ncbi:MAG: ATP-binding cassette domain-containing protein [Micavibrio sp.]|nr:ATP-binding cassette domain-containing protein [Micavibrio sp.]
MTMIDAGMVETGMPGMTPPPQSPYVDMLQPLLKALRWRGSDRHIREATPLNDDGGLDSFRETLAHLGYASNLTETTPAAISADMLPAVAIDAGGKPVLLQRLEDIKNLKAPVQVLSFAPARLPLFDGVDIVDDLNRFRPLVNSAFVFSIVIGLMTLAPVYFNRGIYDHIIPAHSTLGMPTLVFGVLLALGAELLLRHLRGRRLAFFGARMDHFVSCAVFERLLFLSPQYTERAAVSAQLARLRDFENVREFFTGPLATLAFEMPLSGVYLIAMAVITGWLALVPVGLVIAYIILLALMRGTLRDNARVAAQAGSQRHEFLLETVAKLRGIRMAGMEKAWKARFDAVSQQAAQASFKSMLSAHILETASYVLMTLGGIATLGFGVGMVIAGDLTVGALVAAMMLVWRVITPLQIACASMTRLQQLSSSSKQVKKLLSLTPEHDSYKPAGSAPKLTGRLSFHRVSLRYSPETEPALLGVSFDVAPGQVIAIKGANGSGKSTILKMVMGLYMPQNGSVRFDGIDIRQFDPLRLRQAMAYVPQQADLFPGTLRENLLLSEPTADDAACRRALFEAAALEDAEKLPKGLDTQIAGVGAESIPHIFRYRIALARAYLRQAPIVLFDEASHSLGFENDVAFAAKIAALRGKSTVLLVTHREDHMQLADVLLVIEKGELTHAGPPQQVLKVLQGKKS